MKISNAEQLFMSLLNDYPELNTVELETVDIIEFSHYLGLFDYIVALKTVTIDQFKKAAAILGMERVEKYCYSTHHEYKAEIIHKKMSVTLRYDKTIETVGYQKILKVGEVDDSME